MDSQLRVFAAYVKAHPGVALSTAAQHFNVSTRTIYNWVRRANTQLAGIAKLTCTAGMLNLTATNTAALVACLNDRTPHGTSAQQPTASTERVVYILETLLSQSHWITIDELSETLYVSRVSVSADLKKAEQHLNSYSLELARKPHYGIKVTGPEANRRACLSALRAKHAASIGQLGTFYDAIEGLAGNAEKILTAENLVVDAVGFQNLLVHLAIVLMRAQENAPVPMDETYLNSISASREFAAAQQIANMLEEHLKQDDF